MEKTKLTDTEKLQMAFLEHSKNEFNEDYFMEDNPQKVVKANPKLIMPNMQLAIAMMNKNERQIRIRNDKTVYPRIIKAFRDKCYVATSTGKLYVYELHTFTHIQTLIVNQGCTIALQIN